MKRKLLQKIKGFTLVEALVAISIFTMSILGLLSVLAGGITANSYSKEKITAAYLAQEGIEYIRNMRDDYLLYSSSPNQGWSAFNTKLDNANCRDSGVGCFFIDQNLEPKYDRPDKPMTEVTINPCGTSSPDGCPPLYYDPATGRYTVNTTIFGSSPSGFFRKIYTVNNVGTNPNDIKIASVVYFKQGSAWQNINFSEDILKWAAQ